jgi:hypothetical protein
MTHMSLKRVFCGWVSQIFHDTSIHIMVHATWKLKHSYTIMDNEDNVVLCSTFCVLSSNNRLVYDLTDIDMIYHLDTRFHCKAITETVYGVFLM